MLLTSAQFLLGELSGASSYLITAKPSKPLSTPGTTADDIPVMSMDGHVHNSGVRLKDLLCAIAMMHIPVQDEHSLSTIRLRTHTHNSPVTDCSQWCISQSVTACLSDGCHAANFWVTNPPVMADGNSLRTKAQYSVVNERC